MSDSNVTLFSPRLHAESSFTEKDKRIAECGGSDLLDAGLRAAKRGWKIFPCNTQKKPLVPWSQAATTDPTTITAWSKWRLVAMWARALPPEVLVTDLDRKHGLDGVREFEQLQGCEIKEFDAPRVITGTAGIHVYTDTTGRDFKNSVSRIAPGIDTKTIGGYCIIPSGDGFYRWLTDPDTAMPPTPQWAEVVLRDAVDLGPRAEARSYLGYSEYGNFILDSACDAIEKAGDGDQEETLNSRSLIVGHYVGGGLLEYGDTVKKLVASGLLMTNYDKRTPWAAKDIEKKVEHAVKDGMKKPLDGEEAFRLMREVQQRYHDNPQLHKDVEELLEGLDAQKDEWSDAGHGPEEPKLNGSTRDGHDKGEQSQAAEGEQPKQDSEQANKEHPWLKPGEQPLIRRMGKGVPDPVAFFIEGLFHELGTGLIASKYFGGKTYVVMGVAASAATGKPFAGRAVLRKGAVVWLAAEGEREVDLRIRAAIRALGCDPDEQPIYVQKAGVPKLLSNKGEEAVMAIVNQAKRAAEAEFVVPLVLVVFDTMIKSAGYKKSENDSVEVNNTIQVMENIAHRAKCFVLTLDHTGRDEDKGARGSSDKPSSVDTYIEIKTNGANKIFHAVKIKGEKGDEQVEFKIVGATEDGQKTAVVKWEKWNGSDEAVRSLNSNARLLLECVRLAIARKGQPRPVGYGFADRRCAQKKEIYAEFCRRHKQGQRMAFQRSWQELVKNDLVTVMGDEHSADDMDKWVYLDREYD